jgi:hypothetical protein
MGRPVLRLATRINRRTRWTAWAIAFACMVLVGSLTLVDGLSAGVDSITARFSTGPTVYLHGNDLLASAIDINSLAALPTDYAVLRVHPGTLIANDTSLPILVASLTEYHDGNATDPFPAGPQQVAIDSGLRAEILAARGPLGATANLTVFSLPSQTLAVAPAPSARPPLLPDTWAWVSSAFLLASSPSRGGPAQAVLTPVPLDGALAARLGLTSLPTVGAIGFTRASISDARAVLVGLAPILALIIGLLVFTTMDLEVAQRREEIRTLRSLGAPPATVVAVYEGQALLLAVLGATLGSALGIVVAHGIVSFAPLLGFPNLVVLLPPFLPVGLAYLLALVACSVAGLLPALHAMRLARGASGVRPS